MNCMKQNNHYQNCKGELDMKKPKNIKIVAISSALVCVMALGGYIGYSKFYSSENEPQEVRKGNIPLIKKNEKIEPVIPKKSTKKKAVGPIIKPETSSSSINTFRDGSGSTIQEERKAALNLLDNQIKDEQKQVKTQPTVIPLVNEVKPATPKPVEQAKPKPSIPQPTPTPVPDPEPEPTPTPVPPVETVDYTALAELVQKAELIHLDNYFKAGAEVVRTELMIAQRMIDEQGSSQAAVNNQHVRLQNALNALVLLGNKVELQALYDQSEEIKTDIYTDESVAELQTAKTQANDVLKTVEVTQETVDQAKTNLQQSIDALKEKEEPYLSLAYLQRLVTEANAIDLTEYTTSTVLIFQNKLDQVTTYLSSETYTKAENEQHLQELQEAMDQLQKKADITQLKALEAQASAIDRLLYTAESLVALDSILSQVTEALSNEEISQEQVETLVQDLSQAINGLTEKGVTADE